MLLLSAWLKKDQLLILLFLCNLKEKLVYNQLRGQQTAHRKFGYSYSGFSPHHNAEI